MKRLLPLIFLFIATNLSAQTWEDTLSKIEKVLSRYKPDIPGAQVCISRNGKILFSKAYGMADMEHGVKLSTESRIEAGSVSKQFTSAAILLLEQEGKLSLDDNLRKHIPEMPEYATTITLRQMMQHISGLKDWGAIASLTGWPRSTKAYSNEDALYIASKQKSLNHQPGAEWLYSNTNYNLLAIIVQRVSGKSLYDYSLEKIFKPAGMPHTEWRANYRKVLRDRAIAYSKDGTGYITNMPNENVYGNGGLLTTAEDLVKWNEYYQSGKLGSPSLLKKQITPTPLNGGRENFYASGLFISEYNGWPLINHDGATAGYRSNLDYFPAQGLSIAWISNSSEFDNDNGELVSTLRNIFIPKKETNVTSATNEQPAFAVSTTQLEKYTGWYRSHRTNNSVKVTIKDNKLVATNNPPLNAVTENRFQLGNTTNFFMFTGLPDKELLVIRSDGDSVYFSKRDSAVVNEKYLLDYVGRYYSDEAEAMVRIEYKNGTLVLSPLTGSGGIVMSPTFKDGFNGAGGSFSFERNKSGKPDTFFFTTQRARKMMFKRIE